MPVSVMLKSRRSPLGGGMYWWAVAAVAVSLVALTVAAWKLAEQSAQATRHAQFQSIVRESEKALLHRMEIYNIGLRSGAGLFGASQGVDRQEWRNFVAALDLERNFPGARAMGYVSNGPPEDRPAHGRRISQAATREGQRRRLGVVFVEPSSRVPADEGLDIAQVPERFKAAMLSASTGRPAITGKSDFPMNQQRGPNFYLFCPFYETGAPVNTRPERLAALRGWIYAPLEARSVLRDLTSQEESEYHLRIFDGRFAMDSALLYSSSQFRPNYSSARKVQRTIEIQQRPWTLEWTSTEEFDRKNSSSVPAFVLVFGLLLTTVVTAFLVLVQLTREPSASFLMEEGNLALPFALFLVTMLGAYSLSQTLEARELEYVRGSIEAESNRVGGFMEQQMEDRLLVLMRMGLRWNNTNGTPERAWRVDARTAVSQLRGIPQMKWVDSSGRVRWVEPGGKPRPEEGRLADSRETYFTMDRGVPREPKMAVSPPLTAPGGYRAVLGIVPLWRNGKPDGYLEATIHLQQLFEDVVGGARANDYAVILKSRGENFYNNPDMDEPLETSWRISDSFTVRNQNWTLEMIPTVRYVQGRRSNLPQGVLFAGFVIAALLALTTRFVMVSHIKSRHVRSSEERLRLLIENTPAAVAMFDKDLRYILTSRRWLQDYSLREDQLVGRTHCEVFPEIETYAHWTDVHKRALAGEIFDGQEEAWQRADGRTEWVRWSIHPWRNAVGAIGGIVMFTEVITGRKEAEMAERNHMAQLATLAKQLERINRLNNAILGSAAYLIIATDNTGKIITFNREAEQALGFTAQEVAGRHVAICWTPGAGDAAARERPGSPGLEDYYRPEAASGPSESEEFFVRKDGTTFPVVMKVTPLVDADNESNGYLAVVEDVTLRREAEAQLRTSEETFRSAMEYAPIGMALVSPEGRLTRVNEAAGGFLGYSREELEAMDFQSITHPADLAADLAQVQSLLDGDRNSYQLEKRFVSNSGRVLWALLSVSLVRHTNGEPNYFVSQFQDITQQKEVERMKNEFVSIVSHELRTPLTSIRGSLGLIIGVMSEEISPRARQLLDIAHKNSERLLLLINDILDIDKMVSGQMTFDLQPVHLGPKLRDLIEANQGYALRHEVSVTLTGEEENVWVQVDPVRFDQVFVNLFSNAAKFSPRAGQVRVGIQRKGSMGRVTVSDEGPGISEEFRARIFGKFSQADSSATRSVGGTGLGLHISKEMVEHMGGEIGFDNNDGPGTTFWFQFPLCPGPHESSILEPPASS